MSPLSYPAATQRSTWLWAWPVNKQTINNQNYRKTASFMWLKKHNMVAINPSDYLAPMTTSKTRNYHPSKLKTITSNTQLYGNSFFPRTVYIPPSCGINCTNPGNLQWRSFIQSVISCSAALHAVHRTILVLQLVFLSSILNSSFFFFFCLLHLYVWSTLDQHFCTLGMTSWKDPAEYWHKHKPSIIIDGQTLQGHKDISDTMF